MLNYWRVYGYSIYNITKFFGLGDLWPSLSPTQQFCRLRGSTCLPICRQISSTLAPWHPKCCWPVTGYWFTHMNQLTKLRRTPFSTCLIYSTMLLYYAVLILSSNMITHHVALDICLPIQCATVPLVIFGYET